MTPELYDDLAPLFAQIANDVRRQNPLVDREDLVQEAALWALDHPAKLSEYLDDEDERRGARKLYGALRNACRQYARRDKAQRLGYDPDDEMFYTLLVLKDELLPAVYDEEAWLPQGGVFKEAPSRAADPAHGNNWVTTLADVSAAVDRLDKFDRVLIEKYYKDGLPQEDIARQIGTDQSTVSRWLDKAVRHVHRELGGSRPHVEPPEEVVGDREAMANSEAIARTEDDYGAA